MNPSENSESQPSELTISPLVSELQRRYVTPEQLKANVLRYPEMLVELSVEQQKTSFYN